MRENSIHLWPSIKPDFIDLYFKMRLPRVLARVIAFREWEGRRVGSEGRRGGGAGEVRGTETADDEGPFDAHFPKAVIFG